VPGFYSESLVPDAAGPRPTSIAFAYIDCDLYSSTVDVLRYLDGHLRNGTILAFDDYFCFSETNPAGERVAAEEFFAQHATWQLVPFLRYGFAGMSFVVEARSSMPSAVVGW